MDPYVIVKVGNQTRRTRTLDSAGKSPVWNEHFMFQISEYDNTFTLTVMDKDTFTADDMVGTVSINLLQLKQRGGIIKDWLFLDYRGRNAGKIEVDVQIIPENMPHLNYMGAFMQGIAGVSRGMMPIPGVTPVPQTPGMFGGGFNPAQPGYMAPNPGFQPSPPVYSPQSMDANLNYPIPPPSQNYPPAPSQSMPPQQLQPFGSLNPAGQAMNQQMAQALASAGLVSPFLLAMMQPNNSPGTMPNQPGSGALPPGW